MTLKSTVSCLTDGVTQAPLASSAVSAQVLILASGVEALCWAPRWVESLLGGMEGGGRQCLHPPQAPDVRIPQGSVVFKDLQVILRYSQG